MSPRLRVLVVDNYDSFVYNLVQYLGQLGVDATCGATTRSPSPRSAAIARPACCSRPARARRSGPASAST